MSIKMEHAVSLLFVGTEDRAQGVLYKRSPRGTRPHGKVTHK